MRLIRKRTRVQYWSNSNFSKKIRSHFGLKSPKALTMEGWATHKEESKEKSPFINWVTDKGFNHVQDIVYFIPDVVWTIRTASIWQYLRNLKTFNKALWAYRSWDYHGLLVFMQQATADMHLTHKDQGHLVRSENTAQELKIISQVLQRIIEDKYHDNHEIFVHKEGTSIFGGKFERIANTLPNPKSKGGIKIIRGKRQADVEFVIKKMSTKLLSWWD